MTTKNKILSEALKQFNSYGVEVVTTRHIARELSMSQGNLHYHFSNKDQLLLALYGQFITEIHIVRRYVPNDVFQKENVLLSMKDTFQIMFNYRFLFLDNEIIWRRLPSLKTKMLELLDLKKAEIKEIILKYIELNIFRSDISEDQIDFLTNQFIFNISTWLSASEYLRIKNEKAIYFARFTFRQWLPYLNTNEMTSWEALL